ncbi:hypothetical protein BGZ73_004559 [Actinomortierella ambigua]|nr:hypothetical protein BGZ73_004559 [Actinomortierella ambigua]
MADTIYAAPSSAKAINQVHRLRERARYDQDTIHAILDAAFIAHVGFTLLPGMAEEDDWPFVMPMIYGRIDDTIYIHGYVSGRMMKALASPNQPKVAITVTLVDGIVVAMSPFNSAMNYRTACLFGHGRLVTDDEEKDKALTAITNHAFKADRWYDSRPTNKIEFKSTKVIAVQIEKASAKIRAGQAKDEVKEMTDEELISKYWSGIVPMKTVYEAPIPTDYNKAPVPAYLLELNNRDN